MSAPQEGDITIRSDGHLIEYDIEDGWDPIANVNGMDLVERIAVLLDPTAALGTPEVVYRTLPGEDPKEVWPRIRAEVMQKARNILRVIEATRAEGTP